MPIKANGPRWGRWQSLRLRLPLTISLVVITILGVVLFAAHREVHSTLIVAGLDRARAASAQVAALLEGSAARARAQLRVIASEPAVREYLKTREPAAAAAAEGELRKLLAGPAPRLVTLWDRGGMRVLEVSAPARSRTRAGRQAVPPGAAPAAEGWRPTQPD